MSNLKYLLAVKLRYMLIEVCQTLFASLYKFDGKTNWMSITISVYLSLFGIIALCTDYNTLLPLPMVILSWAACMWLIAFVFPNIYASNVETVNFSVDETMFAFFQRRIGLVTPNNYRAVLNGICPDGIYRKLPILSHLEYLHILECIKKCPHPYMLAYREPCSLTCHILRDNDLVWNGYSDIRMGIRRSNKFVIKLRGNHGQD